MRTKRILFLVLLLNLQTFAQSIPPFNVEAYKTFLQSTQNLTSDQLRSMHSAGSFQARVPLVPSSIYLDSICLNTL